MMPLESVRSSVWKKEVFVPKLPISVIKELVRQEKAAAEKIRRLKLEVIYNRVEPSLISLVSPEIIDSWKRSRTYGLDPFQFKPRPVLAGLSWQNVLARKKPLLQVTDAYLERVISLLGENRWCIFLSDENGVILRVVSSKDRAMRKYNEKYQLIPGAVWTEMTGGTCANGLCIILNRPIQLWGPEHYTEPDWGLVTCSAAGIFDFPGNLIATLSLSTDSYLRRYSESLSLVVSIACAIQNRLENMEEYIDYFSSLSEEQRQATIIINRQGIITCTGIQVRNILKNTLNKVPKELEGLSLGEVFSKRSLFDAVLQKGEKLDDVKLKVGDRERSYIICSVWPLKDKLENITGCLVVLKEGERKRYAPSLKNLPEDATGAEYMAGDYEFEKIIGKSPKLLEAINIARRAACRGDGILLEGESGVGKEVFARCIHNLSCPAGPFVAVNCAALPKSLIESELFGYEGGAFTGADRRGRPGKIELAHGGTLFLDEIGDMPLEIQPVLLRVLEEKRLMRVGGSRYIPVNFHLIAATNKDLQELTGKKEFRLDLYYRIAVFKIPIPPLRERGSDILELANHFLKEIARKAGLPVPVLSKAAEARLLEYDWPGNVRQLENAMLYAITMCQNGMINVEDLPLEIQGGKEKIVAYWKNIEGMKTRRDDGAINTIVEKKKELEREIIAEALAQTNYSVCKAAAMLGLSRSTLYRKIKEYNLLLR
ncbi:RNA polymerase sigma factor 54 interaction domain [Moorella glycerini]|uniref:Acetoin dehydrogenase operon transcriptional activator AcoR n=1 Tax=Neomoorella stamsii TaxID=1266720 RepID=A0A9X7J144_9FIRM|nr:MULTISPECIES: sigma 54-interacting transcriptional regulator [Moorella]PRR71546.1 Acetoin dehydrogenase operon transcriptional activator AcoR [Moorella stamsii]CEP66579.1 RNA polymerase sigma factor 54 interaction domain [Moorella glycerini]